MTRINTIPAELLLDEHVRVARTEALRPINNVRNGKDSIEGAPDRYKLGEGHEKFARKHMIWCLRQFRDARDECISRGYNITWYDTDLDDMPQRYLNDYKPTRADHRHNLARLCERWRKRTKPYHFNGVKIDDVKVFREYVNMVKRELGL